MTINKDYSVKSMDLQEIISGLKKVIPSDKTIDDVIFVCIGTDRSTGDSLGPYVGTKLKEKGYNNVYGTLIDPVHAVNLEDTLAILPKDKFIIAFDACLGQSTSVGYIQVVNGPLRPGAGVNKQLPPVGDIHMTGIVNVGGFMEYFVLQNTRLSLVMQLGDKIVSAVESIFAQKEVKIVKSNTRVNQFNHQRATIFVTKRKISRHIS
ncbi:hypothetical protein D3C87_78630 [compost metagenome]